MNNLKIIFVFILGYQLINPLLSQTQIELSNPSFEQYGVNTNNQLEGWNTCLYGDNSPPDVHALGELKWNNLTIPQGGSSYLGLVVRPDSTGENISQRLVQPILKDKYYSFQIHLAKPITYLSRIKVAGYDGTTDDGLSETSISFANAVKLQIWGFEEVCQAGALLSETDVIDHTDWQAYTINFKANKDFHHIAFIPVFAQDRAYAGCVLIDECSPLFETDASFSYNYTLPNIDSLFFHYESKFNADTDEYLLRGAFVSYYPKGNKSNYWTYDFSNQGFYSKRFHENSSYRPRITEYRYDQNNVLTDKVVFYEYIHHTAYYKDSKIASIKRYENGSLNGKQKLYWPSGNVMMEFEMSTEKKYQKRDIDNSLVFDYKHRVKHIYMAKEDGMKLEKFKIPKDSELGDLCITQSKELVMYSTRGSMMGKLQLNETSLNPNELLTILRR